MAVERIWTFEADAFVDGQEIAQRVTFSETTFEVEAADWHPPLNSWSAEWRSPFPMPFGVTTVELDGVVGQMFIVEVSWAGEGFDISATGAGKPPWESPCQR